jgi:hypothetical protein
VYDWAVSARERVPKVVHVGRPELGVGEVGDAFKGKPPVIQVYWPSPDKYGFYLLSDLRRVRDDGSPDAQADLADEVPA